MDLQEFYLGLQVTVVGMGVVFVSLYALQMVMYGMRALFYKEPHKAALATNVPVSPEPVAETVEQAGLPKSLVAAISVAVAAYMGGRPGNIIAIRRTSDGKSPWQHAARIAPLENRISQ